MNGNFYIIYSKYKSNDIFKINQSFVYNELSLVEVDVKLYQRIEKLAKINEKYKTYFDTLKEMYDYYIIQEKGCYEFIKRKI